ncbi:ElyC/SanA/YdcF family protein [Tabrizicola soli]|uniref:ElyC/SanA/YdcF family protein n=1 Tax=Tabrizicola soli TaxID=2185115 RepID=A0ABV7E016_9RHOB|nr:ElyC/SanA/YdcF family protein [Tabrizicola soli]
MLANLTEVKLVLAMHRSGSSLLTGALQAAGAGLGQFEDSRNWANPSGYFENPVIRDFGDALLARLNASWDNWGFRPDAAELAGPAFSDLRHRAVDLLHEVNTTADGPLLIKDPRIAQILPFWEQALSEAGIARRRLLLVRDPAEVATSQCARAARAPKWHPCLRHPEPVCALWAQTMHTVLTSLGDDATLLILHDDLYRAPRDTALAAAQFLGMDPKIEALDAFLATQFSADLRRSQPASGLGMWGKLARQIFHDLAQISGPRILTRNEAQDIARRQVELVGIQPCLPAVQQSLAAVRDQVPPPVAQPAPAPPQQKSTNGTLRAATRDAISRFLFVQDKPEHVDLAFVLGSPAVNSLFPALALFQANLIKHILISGGGPTSGGIPEWMLYRDHAVDAGVPPKALLLEKYGRNTLENFAFGATLVEREIGWTTLSSIGICAKPFHMQRALMTARRFIPAHVRLLAFPAEHPDNLSRTSWADTPAGTKRVLQELGKISKYALQGDFDAD